MSLAIRPLFSALWRNPTGALLVAVQVTITLAVLVNVAWVATQRIEKIERPTGLDVRDTFEIMITGGSKRFDVAVAQTEDLAYLRSLPAVVAATATLGLPMTFDGSSTEYWREPGQRGAVTQTNEMELDEQGLKTLDVSLIAGRNFRADEIRPQSGHAQAGEIIVTRSLAHALFPHADALGKTVYASAGAPLTIIGITHDFMGPQIAPRYRVALRPGIPHFGNFFQLLVRARPGQMEAVMRAAKRHIGASRAYGVVDEMIPLRLAKLWYDAKNGTMVIYLSLVTGLMLAVCCVGVFGLGTFNVGSRARQIGIRRALGARRRDVVTHFMVENALVLTAGMLMGCVLALAAGDWLTTRYAVPRLDPAYLLAGVAVLCVVGQLAAWQPARRAARVPPSLATRTV